VELRGRSVLLTGATGGIGRAAALRLARAGARLALVARSEEPLRALASEVSAAGGEAIAVPADVTVPADCTRAVSEAVSRFQGLDALVNNAGVGYLRAIDEATEAEIEEMVRLNLLGLIRMTRAALPSLLARPGSALVNVASYAGKVAFTITSGPGLALKTEFLGLAVEHLSQQILSNILTFAFKRNGLAFVRLQGKPGHLQAGNPAFGDPFQ